MAKPDQKGVPAHKTTIMIHCLATPKGWREKGSAASIMKEVTL